MRRTLLYLAVLLALGAVACKKHLGDVSGTAYIYGRLVMNDPVTGTGINQPLPGKTVYLSHSYDPGLPGNFLFSMTTDSLGYFLFQNLGTDSGYRVQYTDTVNGLVHFADSGPVQASDNTLLLIAQPLLTGGGTGFEYIFKDDKTPAGPLPGVKLYVFTSLVLQDSAVASTSIDSLTSDSYGRAYLFGLMPGTYYILITGISTVASLSVKDPETITIPANQVIITPMTLP